MTDSTHYLSENLSKRRRAQIGSRVGRRQRGRTMERIHFRRHWGLSAKTRHELGWCDAALETLREAPASPESRRRLSDAALAKGVAGTMALAGASVSEKEAAGLVAGRRLPASQRHVETEARNVLDAHGALAAEVAEGGVGPVTPARVLRLHGLVGQGLGKRFAGAPGRFRASDLPDAPLPCPPAREVAGLVERLCEWLDAQFGSPGANASATKGAPSGGGPVVHAVAAHAYLSWIRPFEDGNGRTARLVESGVLLSSGAPVAASLLLSAHYGETPREYRRQLRRAARDRSVTSFVAYAASGFRDGLDALVRAIRLPQMEAAWRVFVFQRFAEQPHLKTSVFKRRRDLVLALPMYRSFPLGDATALDSWIARTYRSLSERTLRRDLDVLTEMGLLTEDDGQYRTNTAVLRPDSRASADAPSEDARS